MAEMLLINPSHRPSRRKARRSTNPGRRPRARRAAAPRRVRRNPIHHFAGLGNPHRARRRTHSRRVRRNPMHALAHHRRHRRRRNPISLGHHKANAIGMLKAALLGGAGAITVDLLMGQVNKYLPDSLKVNDAQVGVGDAVKGALTIVAGLGLSKMTKGLSVKLAQGALIVQASDILRSFLPSSMTLGYATSARLLRGSPMIGPNAAALQAGRGILPPNQPTLSRYVDGKSPLLNRYVAGSPVLNSYLATGRRSNSNVRAR